MTAWVAGLAPPGARVLEIGCGDGALTRTLAAAGLDVVGVDPNADATPNTLAIPFEDLDAPPFDVVFASVSLHHLPDPAAATGALARLTKAGTVMAVREFDRSLVLDPPTLEWSFHQRRALAAVEPPQDPGEHELPTDFPSFRDRVHHMFDHHVLPWETVRQVLGDAGFDTDQQQRTAYLFRWDLYEALRPVEEHLIAAGRIKAVGIRWLGRRR